MLRLPFEVPTRAMPAESRKRSPGGFAQYAARKPMFDGLDLSKVTATASGHMNWEFVKRLRDTVTVKLLLKGIVTREDAQIAVEHGVDGLIVRIMEDELRKLATDNRKLSRSDRRCRRQDPCHRGRWYPTRH